MVKMNVNHVLLLLRQWSDGSAKIMKYLFHIHSPEANLRYGGIFLRQEQFQIKVVIIVK